MSTTREPELQGGGLRGVSADIDKLLEKIRTYVPPEKIAVVEEAYKFAAEKHRGQVRLSGEPFLEHPLQTAYILSELQFDAASLAAALLHDIPEDTGTPLSELETRFGPEIAQLVDGVTKMGKVTMAGSAAAVTSTTQAENLRKMLLAMAEDLRVVFIKLADRLHNMRTLKYLPREKQLKIAEETLEIYTPLAHRLGIWELKWQLEDLAFSFLQPQEYQTIARLVDVKRIEREKFIDRAIETLKKEFERVGLTADISGRPKHIYSIYQKMQKYASRGKHFDEIYDLFALRVLVGTVTECYSTVGIIHSLWHPLPDTFDDYIANPKPNGYQALHTAVMCFGMTPLEIQVMTREMYHIAEYGVAAHWRYKEGTKADLQFEDRIAWLRQLIEWHRELSGAEEFLESVKTDIFIDQVFVYTPKGEIKDLPKGATPLDFAYRVHTDLGHRCIGAKVNGKLVPFNTELKNGDVVEILASKTDRGPSLDWLNPNLGYVHTSHAMTKIRQWFNKQTRSENIERGRLMLDKELRRLGIKTEREVLAGLFGYTTLEDFYAEVGSGGVTSNQIVLKLAAQEEKVKGPVITALPRSGPSGVQVLGVGDLMTNLAQCCHPVPGDKIIGYITRSRGVTVHRADCINVINEDEKERLIPVEWGHTDLLYPVKVQVEAWDRVGLMRDVTTVVAEEKINIASVNLTSGNNQNITMYLTLETKGLAQLSQILKKIEGVRGVTAVSRVGTDSRGGDGAKPGDSSKTA
ncbi:MAG TPA: bifunctional (p)ppGpp synthetase/guanosine-3',5'-bis(diphosphate) 3'-pyrophosphohydrolase [Dehalococcoidales bacterium]|nr:bifunctional (p)ppGpp synthetase/guanosine-3',5'-bis(diphosphate) 3'-pyrophosphohydrolase [Dehalococcoidales bacterium]